MSKRIFDRIKLFLYPLLFYILNNISNKWTRTEVYGKEKLEGLSGDTPLLYAFWHGKLWLPVYYFRGLDYLVLSSLSRDGEYMTRVLKRYGYQIIRGSSSRGGSRALLALIKEIKKGNSAFITPDGPTGPVYKVNPGIIYLQEKTGVPIVPLGVAIKHKKVFNSWDRLNFPLPGTRAVMIFGELLEFKPDSCSIEERAVLLEEALNRVQKKAEELLEIKYSG